MDVTQSKKKSAKNREKMNGLIFLLPVKKTPSPPAASETLDIRPAP